MTTVRICVCGDKGVGKSSLIAGLVKDTFVTGRIQAVLPQITIPPIFGTAENVTTVIADTSALPEHRDALNREIRRCNVVLLVYSDHYSYERLGLFWLPHFRSLGVNVPVILCAAKTDAQDASTEGAAAGGDASSSAAGGMSAAVSSDALERARALEEETLPLMGEFKEVDSSIRTSAKEKHNVREAFFLCQKAVTHPVAPLYDSKAQMLKPAAERALRRIFWLADLDKDGRLSDAELQTFQEHCFGKPLGDADLVSIKQVVAGQLSESITEAGIDATGFILLNKYFIDKGRHETVWIILRTYHYSDGLSLRESFMHPKFEVPAFSSAELSPAGYQFFFDLFLRFDQDKDGGLNDNELAALFAPTPGLPTSWIENAAINSFPSSAVRNEAGHITLQGWLAQWSMTTFVSPRTTLEYLAYLGFEPADPRGTNASALKTTRPRKKRFRPGRIERNVVHAFVVGPPGAGKSSLLDAFLNRPFTASHRAYTGQGPRTAVNSVELPGGKQCYLILEELVLGGLEESTEKVLQDRARLEASDLLVYAYDSGNADSFAHLARLRRTHTHLRSFPGMFVALKADTDRAVQRGGGGGGVDGSSGGGSSDGNSNGTKSLGANAAGEAIDDDDLQPDAYCEAARLSKPHHVSVTWPGIQELFVAIADLTLNPVGALPKDGPDSSDSGRRALGVQDGLGVYLGVGAAVAAGAAGLAIWRKSRQE